MGEFVDTESLTALKDVFNRLDCDNFEIRSNACKLSPDLRSGYLMNSKITGIEESDLLLLIGSNPRHEAPVMNARILKATKKNNLKVAVIGTPSDLTYEYMHLGSSPALLSDIANGTHPFSQRLLKAKLPMIIVGGNLLERSDSEVINKILYIHCFKNLWKSIQIIIYFIEILFLNY